MVDIGRTYGALLLGGLIAFGFSGIVTVQSIIYFKLYHDDKRWKKMMVMVVWLLDLVHSAFVCCSLFYYFILWFGKELLIDRIPWSVALSIVVTAIQTLIAHCFFAQKIYTSSRRNLFVTFPILVLAFARLVAASVSTTEMIRLKHFSAFMNVYPGWVFTLGVSLSAAVDILITGWLFYFLRSFRRKMGPSLMVHVVNSLMLYTLENGLLTCLTTTATLICWLTMRDNLVFLGIHVVIEKLYANSLLASLNTRKELNDMRSTLRPPQWNNLYNWNPYPHSTSDSPSSSPSPWNWKTKRNSHSPSSGWYRDSHSPSSPSWAKPQTGSEQPEEPEPILRSEDFATVRVDRRYKYQVGSPMPLQKRNSTSSSKRISRTYSNPNPAHLPPVKRQSKQMLQVNVRRDVERHPHPYVGILLDNPVDPDPDPDPAPDSRDRDSSTTDQGDNLESVSLRDNLISGRRSGGNNSNMLAVPTMMIQRAPTILKWTRRSASMGTLSTYQEASA